MTTEDRPSAWDVLKTHAPEGGVLQVRVGVVVDLVCTSCKAGPPLVRVLDTEYGRMVVSRVHDAPSAEALAAKVDHRWKGGTQQHVPHPPGAQPPDHLPALAKRRWHLAGMGDPGWTDRPFWFDPWPLLLFAYGPRCRCQTADTWSGSAQFKVVVAGAVTRSVRNGKRVAGLPQLDVSQV